MAAAAAASSSGAAGRPLIIAHRGASHDAPENTLGAFHLAWVQKADGVEVDIWQSSDGRIIISHDRNTKRTTGVSLEIPSTPSPRLRQLNAAAFKGSGLPPQKLPFLEEALAAVPPGKTIYIEIKCPGSVLPALKKAIDGSAKGPQIVIIGFDLETVAESKMLLPHLQTLWLRGTVKDPNSGAPAPYGDDLVAQARANNLDGLNLESSGITPETVKAAHAADLILAAWTVDSATEAARLQQIGVDVITTNRPGALLAALDAPPRASAAKDASLP